MLLWKVLYPKIVVFLNNKLLVKLLMQLCSILFILLVPVIFLMKRNIDHIRTSNLQQNIPISNPSEQVIKLLGKVYMLFWFEGILLMFMIYFGILLYRLKRLHYFD